MSKFKTIFKLIPRVPEYIMTNKGLEQIPFKQLVEKHASKYKEYLNPKEITELPENVKALALQESFNPLYEIDTLGFNKIHAKETIRRLEALGYDLDKPLGEKGIIPRKFILEDNFKKPTYLGYFNEEGVGGEYFPKSGVAFVDPTQRTLKNVPSIIFHERNMHGTDDIYRELSGDNNIYKEFINKIFKDSKELEDLKLAYNNTHSFNKDSLLPEEARSTIGELIRKYAFNNPKGQKDLSIKQNRKLFEDYVDSLPEANVINDLMRLNTYGNAYGFFGKKVLKDQFVPYLKTLLKTAPVVATVVGIGNYEQ